MGLVGSHGSGWTTTTQWLLACSNQADVTVRDSVVAGITQTSASPLCHTCSSSPIGSLIPGGSRIERSTRFPWTISTRSTSVSVRTPMVGCRFMVSFVFSLWIMRTITNRNGILQHALSVEKLASKVTCVSRTRLLLSPVCMQDNLSLYTGDYSNRSGQKRQV